MVLKGECYGKLSQAVACYAVQAITNQAHGVAM